jgi:hypothetical protein
MILLLLIEAPVIAVDPDGFLKFKFREAVLCLGAIVDVPLSILSYSLVPGLESALLLDLVMVKVS